MAIIAQLPGKLLSDDAETMMDSLKGQADIWYTVVSKLSICCYNFW